MSGQGTFIGQQNTYQNLKKYITKRLLLDLASKRKSLKKDKLDRIKWAESLENNQKNQGRQKQQRMHEVIQKNQKCLKNNQNNKKLKKQEIIVLDQSQIQQKVQPRLVNNYKYSYKIDNNISNNSDKSQILLHQLNKAELKIQCLQTKKQRLFPLSLKNLTTLFLTQINSILIQKTHPQNNDVSAVHRAILSNIDIKNQISKLVEIMKGIQCWHHFNQDRMIMLYQKRRKQLQCQIFDQQFVTIYQHRALAMIIKRINSNKFSLHIPSSNQASQNLSKQRNILTNKFYVQLYSKPIQQYYKQLLQFQIIHKRYIGTVSKKKKPIIGVKPTRLGATNFIRKLMLAVFQDKVRGQGQIKQQILQLQTNIQTAIVAQDLLSQMRMEIQGDINCNNQQNLNNQMQDQGSTCQGLLGGRKISKNQKLAIERALQGFKKNRKQVPYPYCMFLQYRLRAQKQPSYNNPQNPSSDEDEQVNEVNKRRQQYKKFRQLNVYRGYRGYKTNNRIAQVRKMNKGISKNVKQLAKQQQFYLKTLANKKSLLTQLKPETMSHEKKEECPKESQIQVIPFPYYLSIFSQNSLAKKNEIKSSVQMQQQIIRTLQQLHKSNSTSTVKSNFQASQSHTDKRSHQMIDLCE